MRLKSDVESQNTKKAHQSNIKRLSAEHKNELDALKNMHAKNKNNLTASHKDQLHLQKVNHDNKLAMKSIENEKIYNKLQENLNQVKERIAKTKNDLNQKHKSEVQDQRTLHQVERTLNNDENADILKEANDTTSGELNRLRKEYKADKESLIHSNNNEKSFITAKQRSETQVAKQSFRKEHAHLTDENARALFNIKKDHSRLKNDVERKNLKEITERRNIWGSELSKIDESGSQIKSAKQAEFEKDYAIQYKKNEELAKTLMKNKEKIAKEFTDELTYKFEVGAEKSDDPFYDFGVLDIGIDETFEGNGYDISIPIAEHEAKSIKIVAEGRNIRVTMEREHQDSITEDGSTDKIAKIETFTAKRSVEDILDPTTISKSYDSGTLTFRVLKA